MKWLITKLKAIEEIIKNLKVVTAFITAVIIIISNLIPREFIIKIDQIIWFWLVVVLVIICVALVIYVFAQRPKYLFIRESGIWQEKKTGIYFCTSCMTNGKKSPLKEYEIGWKCLTKDCNRLYYKPGKEPEPLKRRVISKGINNGWVRQWQK